MSEDVIDPFMQQAFELWINPEIERRRQDGRLSANEGISMIQVIFNRDAPIEVRLNHEVRAVARMRVRGPIARGQAVMASDVDEIETIDLTENDPNAGHITMIFHQDHWFARFDFRYNADRVSEHIAAAHEFLACATFALDSGFLRPFVENLLAAAELTAKGLLMMHDDEVIHNRKHSMITTRFNKWGKLGNTDQRYTRQLNALWELRTPARYLSRDLNLSEDEARTMLELAHEMLASLQESAPIRVQANYDKPVSLDGGQGQTT